MSGNGQQIVEHDAKIDAPAAEVYRLLADVERWPEMFPPSVHVECLERNDEGERIRIWATANGAAKTWTSRRTPDPDGLRIGFRQEISAPPVAQMGGTWIVEPLSDDRCVVRLLHDYRALDDDPDALRWIADAVDGNSRSELEALRATAEMRRNRPDLMLSFTDEVTFAGPAGAAYDFVDRADLWDARLPHVARVEMTEDTPGLQVLEMDTRTGNGATHTTRSVRVTFPQRAIAYKQTLLPALMTVHTGLWTFAEDGAGTTTATSRHTVVINEENIASVLGRDAGPAAAREFVHRALSANSLATLGHARDHAVRVG